MDHTEPAFNVQIGHPDGRRPEGPLGSDQAAHHHHGDAAIGPHLLPPRAPLSAPPFHSFTPGYSVPSLGGSIPPPRPMFPMLPGLPELGTRGARPTAGGHPMARAGERIAMLMGDFPDYLRTPTGMHPGLGHHGQHPPWALEHSHATQAYPQAYPARHNGPSTEHRGERGPPEQVDLVHMNSIDEGNRTVALGLEAEHDRGLFSSISTAAAASPAQSLQQASNLKERTNEVVMEPMRPHVDEKAPLKRRGVDQAGAGGDEKRARMAEAAERRRLGMQPLPPVDMPSKPGPGEPETDDEDIIEVVSTSGGRPSTNQKGGYGLRQGRRRTWHDLNGGEDEVIILSDDEMAAPVKVGGRRASAGGGGRESTDVQPLAPEEGPSMYGGATEEAVAYMESCLSYLTADGAQSDSGRHYQFSRSALEDMISRLIRDEVLNDEVLNRAVILLSHDERSKGVLLFNTFWYEKIKDGKAAEAKTWCDKAMGARKPEDLHHVCVPVNISNAHWVLTVVDLQRRTVVVWDPAGSDHPDIARNVADTMRTALGISDLCLKAPPSTLPQQSDNINCGVFVILYLIYICIQVPQSSTMSTCCAFSVRAPDLFRYRVNLLYWILCSQVIPPEICGPLEEFLRKSEPKLSHLTPAPQKKLLQGILDDSIPIKSSLDTVMAQLNTYRPDTMFLDSSWYRAIAAGHLDEAFIKVESKFAQTSNICAVVYPNPRQNRTPLLAHIELRGELPVINLYGFEGLDASDIVFANLKRFLQREDVLTKQCPIDLQEGSRLCDVALVVLAMHIALRGGPPAPLLFSEDGILHYKHVIIRWLLRCLIM